MKQNIFIIIIVAYLSVFFSGCKTQKSTQNVQNTQSSQSMQKESLVMAIQPTIIYKTKKNYDKNVGILLSDDKKTIIGYPHPTDVSARSYPTPLKNGYLFDNRGIGKNVAFISLTYEEYAALKTSPSLTELLNMVIDNDPLEEMYLCKERPQGTDLPAALNQLIDKKFEGCIQLK